MLSMKKSFFPERTSRDIYVNVFYPGASPEEMEEGVTIKIEEALRGLVGIKEVNSTSSENFSSVRVLTTGEYDIDVVLQEVKNAIDGVSSFPENAEKPVVFKQRNTTPAINLALASNEADLLTLKRLAMRIEDDLRASGLISQININGYPELEISVEISEEQLLRYNLTFDEVSRAIAKNNLDISAGEIRSEKEEIYIRSREKSVDPNEIAKIIVRANPDGSYLRIGDVGEVRKQFAETPNKSYVNGERSVSFFVRKLVNEDLEEISIFVNKYVDEFNKSNQKVTLYVTFDFLVLLKQRLHMLYENGLVGLLLVLITLTLFLSFRLSLWVAFGIPISFLGMFFIANMYGITINMLSLFGMILVVGILVDDGIVIAENIYSHYEKGKSPRKAALDGSLEVLPAVLTSIITTMVAFSPLLLLNEGRMEIMFEMAFVVIASLFFSLVEAFLVLPTHIGHESVLKTKKSKAKWNIRAFLNKFILRLRDDFYGKVLTWVLNWRYLVISLPVVFIIVTAGLFKGGLIKFTFFPPIEFDFFTVDVAFTPGSGEKKTWDYLLKFDSIAWQTNEELLNKYAPDEEKRSADSIIKYTYPILGNAFDYVEVGSHAGRLFVQTQGLEEYGISNYDVISMLRKNIGEVNEAEKFKIGGHNRFGKPISISLLGQDIDQLNQAEKQLYEDLINIQEINDVVKVNPVGQREVQLKLKPKAYMLGLDHISVSNQVRQGFFGGLVQRLQEGKDEIKVWVRYPKEDRYNIGQLENMKIKTPRGEYPLKELVWYDIKRGPVKIKRYQMQREVKIEADLKNPNDAVPPILENIEKNVLPSIRSNYPDVKMEYQGQQKSSRESMDELQKYYIIAMILIFMILMLHFRSFGHSAIILLMIPLAWIGSAWGHGLHGKPLSILSAWGMVALSGVIINDAVVFLSKYKNSLREGMKVKKAVYEAGISRFRPILLTSVTTSVGLYPIILEKSFQAQFLIPMALSLVYGVMIGTIFIMIIFPSLIMVLNDLKVGIRWLWIGKRPKRKRVEKID